MTATMAPPLQLAIDRIRCDGAGLCADLLPELIELDDWGYPIVEPGPVPDRLLAHARRAVDACPMLALRLAVARERSAGTMGAMTAKASQLRTGGPAGAPNRRG